jgi:hypothetical protein
MTPPASGADSARGPPDYAPVPPSTPGPQPVTGRAASPGATAGGGNRRLGLALLVIATAQLMVVLDATIVNVALPHIQQALGFSGSGLEWVVNAYAVTFGGLLLLGGRAGDILGRRRVFVFGLLLFSGASLLGGFATSQWWLLTARAVQGAGGAVVAPTALALITTNFPEGGERNRAFSVYAAMAGAGSAVGPDGRLFPRVRGCRGDRAARPASRYRAVLRAYLPRPPGRGWRPRLLAGKSPESGGSRSPGRPVPSGASG